MRKLVPLFGSLLCSLFCSSQSIDALHSNEQVRTFLKDLLHEETVYITIPKEKQRNQYPSSPSFEARTFEKADLDHNGFTDLLFNGYGYEYHQTTLVVLAYGNDSFQVKDLRVKQRGYFAARILFIKDAPFVHTLNLDYKYNKEKDSFLLIEKTDTLQCAFGEFIEKGIPGHYTLEQLEYCCWGGFGVDLGYLVKVQGDSATLERGPSIRLSKTDSGGVFVARLSRATYTRITGLLNQINFPNLESHYEIDATCQSTGMIRIVYNNGNTKEISDYGLCGTYGLAALQDLLLNLYETQEWAFIRPVGPLGPVCR